MPPPQQRKVAFSTKRKKEQLKAKRERKRQENQAADSEHSNQSSEPENTTTSADKILVDTKERNDNRANPNRYRLLFLNESKDEIEKRKRDARKPLPAELLPQKALEIDLDDIYKPGSVLDIPKRPSWDYKESKAQLEAKEQKYFRGYVENIMKMYDASQLSYFELNIETWRQLWRVLEMSDVILLITDIRHPGYHFSPALYNHVTQELGKDIILVLNKIDLVPPAVVTAWRHFFSHRYPQLEVVCFTSFPKDEDERNADSDETKIMRRRKRKRVPAVGPYQLLEVCEKLVRDKVDLLTWRQKMDSASQGDEEVEGHESRVVNEEDTGHHPPSASRFHNGVLTIGCCGYPNVGKSSLINGLVGKKVVSVSRTPGHTKHFQTIYLTSTVRLCDCPGLVFPALVDKPMQVLAGIFPIAQLREPYTAIAYLAQRLPITRLLRLQSPSDRGDNAPWTAFDICWAWAEKRGFFTAKAARPDVYRAANNILRLALEGRLCLCHLPPGFTDSKELWEVHPDTLELMQLQNAHRKFGDEDKCSQGDDSSMSEDEEHGVLHNDENDDSASDDDDDTDAPAASVNKFDLLADDD